MTVSGESRGGGGPTRAFWFWAVESRAISGLCGCVSEGTREQARTWDRRDTPRAAWGERGQDSDPNMEGQAAGRPDWGGGVKRRPLRSGRWRRGRVAADGGGLRKVSLYKGLSSFHLTIFARPVPTLQLTTTRLGARRAGDPQALQPRPLTGRGGSLWAAYFLLPRARAMMCGGCHHALGRGRLRKTPTARGTACTSPSPGAGAPSGSAWHSPAPVSPSLVAVWARRAPPTAPH